MTNNRDALLAPFRQNIADLEQALGTVELGFVCAWPAYGLAVKMANALEINGKVYHVTQDAQSGRYDIVREDGKSRRGLRMHAGRVPE